MRVAKGHVAATSGILDSLVALNNSRFVSIYGLVLTSRTPYRLPRD